MKSTIQKLADDFENERGPFSKDLFPEARLVDELGDPYKVEYLSLFCTLDYNRSVDNLVNNILELHEVDDGYGTNYFHPPDVVGVPKDEMKAVFRGIGFRYGNRDAEGWHENCVKAVNDFGGSWSRVIASSGHHAPTLVKVLRDEEFKFIKGDKLAPFYARVVNDYVHTLDDLWMLDIPVDTWVRKLTQEFLQKDMTDDEIRTYWKGVGEELDISPAVVDGGIWMMGYEWENGGREYLTKLTGRETFKYL